MSTEQNVANTWPGVADKVLDNVTSGVSGMVSTLKQISTEMSKQVPYVWKGLVEYHRYMAISQLIINIIVLIAAIVGIVWSIKCILSIMKFEQERNENYWTNSSTAKSIIAMVIGGFSIIFSGRIFYTLPADVGDVVLPERAAALEVINIIKSGGTIPER